jgi:tetratricopeptide (TPR) repeat protein
VDDAIACHRKAIALDPKLAMAHTNLGVALWDKGKVEEAFACYQEAVALDPKLAMAHLGLGVALWNKGKVEEAFACYQEAIALDPNLAMAYNNLGAILCDVKRDYDKAIACFHKAIARDPTLVLAHTGLGVALYRKGKVDEAIACFQKAIAVNSNYAHARALLANAKRMATIRDKFAAFQKGTYKPATPSERLDLAEWCQLKKLHHTAAELYAAAFAEGPTLADNLNAGHRYNAACVAALAASGQGEDAAKLDEREKARWRRQALTWLRADLAQRAKQLAAGKPADRQEVAAQMQHWQQDSDLAGLRDRAALAKLPAEQQKACTQLWADVATLLKKAQEKTN